MAGTEALGESTVAGEGASSQVFLQECSEESGTGHPSPKPPSTNAAEKCVHTILHLSDSEREQRKAREEGKRNWYSLTDVLSAEPSPIVLFSPRPLVPRVQEECTAFSFMGLESSKNHITYHHLSK